MKACALVTAASPCIAPRLQDDVYDPKSLLNFAAEGYRSSSLSIDFFRFTFGGRRSMQSYSLQRLQSLRQANSSHDTASSAAQTNTNATCCDMQRMGLQFCVMVKAHLPICVKPAARTIEENLILTSR
mmetsp:Transcript_14505/g.49539  ORF Transcript_14505/g.49539 Transcript_14505/m.49539 type:complete len:128 (-) Transcript_14505:119-502(-)